MAGAIFQIDISSHGICSMLIAGILWNELRAYGDYYRARNKEPAEDSLIQSMQQLTQPFEALSGLDRPPTF